MDVNRLTQGEKIAGVAAIVLFISMFFAWFGFDSPAGDLRQFGVDVGDVSFSFNAWESFSFIDLILLLTVLVTLAMVFVKLSDTVVDFPLNTVVAALGGLATLLVLYRIIDPPGGSDREWGVFLGLILSALVAYGGYRAMQEEGSSFGDAADRFSSGRGAGPGAGSPPPPPPTAGGQPPAGGPPPAGGV
jgi:hypothetical protein